MAQEAPPVENLAYPAFRAFLNQVLAALRGFNIGTSAPTTTGPAVAWADQTNKVMKHRDTADAAWVPCFSLDADKVRTAKTTNYTVAASDFDILIPMDASGGALTVTLPAAATAGEGFRVLLCKDDTTINAVTIDADGSETINGQETLVLGVSKQIVMLICTGSGWFSICANQQPLRLHGQAINDGPLAGLRNYIINGGFDIWQRGTSFSATGWTADRWYLSVGGGAATVSQQAYALGTTIGGIQKSHFLQWAQSSGGTGPYLLQPIEGVRTLAGQDIAVSFWGRVTSSTLNLQVGLQQVFGTGGSPSSTVPITAQTVQLTTSWQLFTLRFAIPSISGKTIGNNGNDYLSLVFTGPNSSTFTAQLDLVQAEPGPIASLFERRPRGLELMLCQRYYWKSFRYAVAPAQNAGREGAIELSATGTTSNLSVTATVRLPVVMRTDPTITTYNPLAANANWRNVGAASNLAATVSSIGDQSFAIFNNAASADNALYSIHADANAEPI